MLNRLRFALVLLLVAPAMVFSQQTWKKINSMNDARFCYSLIALNDGTVLAIGGQDIGSNALGSCELFDPATGNWSYTAPLSVARGAGKAVKLSDGRVAIIGGQTQASVAQTDAIEIYDPVSKTWGDGGHLLVARQNETLNYIDDNTILIVGGLTQDGTTAECEIYNSATKTCRAIAPMHQNRHDHMSIPLSNGDVLVAGGRDGGAGSRYFNESEEYNFSTDTWTVISPMFQERIVGVLTQFPDGSILAAGGRNTPNSSATGSELLDQSTLQWSKTAPILQPVASSGNVMLADSRFLMTGGQIGGDWYSGIDNVTTPTCEWYDRLALRWYYAPLLNLSRDKHGAVALHQEVTDALPSDIVMVAGGLVGILTGGDSIHGTMRVNPYITNSVEVLDVTPNSMQYYIQHQPQSAGVDRNPVSAVSGLHIEYSSDFSPVLQFSADQSATMILEITDVRGSVVLTSQSTVNPGQYSIPLGTTGLREGMYFVHLSGGDINQTAKLLIKR
jgi:hypothetical protein